MMSESVCEAQRFFNEGGASVRGQDLLAKLKQAGAVADGEALVFPDGSRGRLFPDSDGGFVPTHDCAGKALDY
jgi:hypothetical protein